MTPEQISTDKHIPDPPGVPRGALTIVGLVFASIMALWFLVLGIVQARS
jgi:hypothetical protein